MSEETFFSRDHDTPAQTGHQEEPKNDDIKRDTSAYVEVNGRKYSLEEAQKKISHADEHISKLEHERATDRERVEKLIQEAERAKTLEEVLERMEAQQHKVDEGSQSQPAYNPDEIINTAVERAEKVYENKQLEAQRQQNLASVAKRLEERYGEKADDEAFGKMEELGYSREEAFELAKTKPSAFFRLLGMDSKERKLDPTPMKGDVRTSVAQDQGEKPRNDLMQARSTKERIDMYNRRVQQKMEQLGLN